MGSLRKELKLRPDEDASTAEAFWRPGLSRQNSEPLWLSFPASEIHPNDSAASLSKTKAPSLEYLPHGLDVVGVWLTGASLEISDRLRCYLG